MYRLEKLLDQCQEDTARICNQGAANRLNNWRRYDGNQPALIGFIQQRLRGNGRINGWLLEDAGGLSLERIVIYHCPELFTQDDIKEAKATLRIE